MTAILNIVRSTIDNCAYLRVYHRCDDDLHSGQKVDAEFRDVWCRIYVDVGVAVNGSRLGS